MIALDSIVSVTIRMVMIVWGITERDLTEMAMIVMD